MRITAQIPPPTTRLTSALRICILYLLTAFIAIGPLTGCSDHLRTITNLDSSGTTLVCFGDSITAGYGVTPDQAFPALIGEQLGMPVINAGVVGDTTADAILRLERDVLVHNPRAVLVEFGGNDFRKKMDKAETFRNLNRIVGGIIDHGAMVIVLEIRIGVIRDEYLAGYRDVAQSSGAILIPNFMSGILGNSRLTVDGIHPNPEGHELIAERVMEKLAPLLGKAEQIRVGKQ